MMLAGRGMPCNQEPKALRPGMASGDDSRFINRDCRGINPLALFSIMQYNCTISKIS